MQPEMEIKSSLFIDYDNFRNQKLKSRTSIFFVSEKDIIQMNLISQHFLWYQQKTSDD
jgi:hypothetical protein